jgi:hypothetical protein
MGELDNDGLAPRLGDAEGLVDVFDDACCGETFRTARTPTAAPTPTATATMSVTSWRARFPIEDGV